MRKKKKKRKLSEKFEKVKEKQRAKKGGKVGGMIASIQLLKGKKTFNQIQHPSVISPNQHEQMPKN